MLPDGLSWLLAVNPFADIMAVAHGLIQGLSFDLYNLVRPLAWWVILLAPSWVLFLRLERHMREAL
jgi:lipopolysaccharide transport system permease protein